MEDDLLPYALIGLEQRRAEIAAKIAEIRQLLGGTALGSSSQGESSHRQTAATKRVMSAEARERIAQAQRERWAATRRGSTTKREAASTKKAATGKRNLSPEARARIAAAQRKRWAAARKAK
jgi:hypothetical protein